MKNLVQEMLVPSTPSEIQANLLALRQENFMNDFISRFKLTLNGIYSEITNSLSGLINDSYDVTNRSVKKNQSTLEDFEKKLPKLNFVLHADTLVPIPDGFNGSWLAYNQTLEANRILLVSQTLGALEDFNTFLASFIGNKESKISLQDNGKKYKMLQKAREDQNEVFLNFFGKGVQQRAKLSSIFENKEDIAKAAQVSINNWKEVSKLELRQIHGRCEEIARKMDMVIKQLESSSDKAVSKQALLNLSEGGFEAASQIEHLAKYVARSEIAMVTCGNQIDRLVSLIK